MCEKIKKDRTKKLVFEFTTEIVVFSPTIDERNLLVGRHGCFYFFNIIESNHKASTKK